MESLLTSEAFIDSLQWPAMAATLVAAWLVGEQRKYKRFWGFVAFIISNILWVIWGWHVGAYALIFLQFGLFAINIRGTLSNEETTKNG